MEEGRRAGFPLRRDPRRMGRCGRGPALFDHPDGRAGAPQPHGARLRTAFRYRGALYRPLRHPRAEACLAAQDGVRRCHCGDCHDGAGRWLGSAGDPHHRHQGWRRIRDFRPEDLHHQRPDRRPFPRRVQDRPLGRRTRHQPRDGGGRSRRVRARTPVEETRHQGAGYLGAVLQRRARAGHESHRGGRARASAT